jgi:muconolactone delta-isomerase
MKRSLLFIFVIAGLPLLASTLAVRQQAQAQTAAPASGVSASQGKPDPAQIIRAVAAKETQFRQALTQYAFKRDAVVQTIGMGGQITGEYHRVSLFTFDDKGNRYEKINFFPMSSLSEVTIGTEDLQDMESIQFFALEVSKLDQYNVTYVGKEHVDELDLYVFDVAPKVMPDPKKSKERFFQGRIWVDDHDLQIVKSRGKGVPEGKNSKYPIFETYREQIDGRYWFPTYSYADEDLVFNNGQVVHLRARIRYTDYALAHSTVTITEIDEDKPESKPQAKPSPTPAPTTPPAKKP